jgi:predicted DNA-binding antitoxin AbrB/MazE fold protein
MCFFCEQEQEVAMKYLKNVEVREGKIGKIDERVQLLLDEKRQLIDEIHDETRQAFEEMRLGEDLSYSDLMRKMLGVSDEKE